ncbi:hypothetical protein SRABI133_03724 [Peribacillus simplex]|uniref:Transposase n=1 Tax=Peribacillus simplex TaxID=1478 RepID=A0A9W4KZR2_9BACI|nr:hypothetical protein SRABI133_03724 [Peribacillus simplex]
MLSKYDSIQHDQLEMITLDQLVPANHLFRKYVFRDRDAQALIQLY